MATTHACRVASSCSDCIRNHPGPPPGCIVTLEAMMLHLYRAKRCWCTSTMCGRRRPLSRATPCICWPRHDVLPGQYGMLQCISLLSLIFTSWCNVCPGG
jgi:hypothetical protein